MVGEGLRYFYILLLYRLRLLYWIFLLDREIVLRGKVLRGKGIYLSLYVELRVGLGFNLENWFLVFFFM